MPLLVPAGNASAWTGPTGNNTWLLPGRVPALIDAGVGSPDHVDALATRAARDAAPARADYTFARRSSIRLADGQRAVAGRQHAHPSGAAARRAPYRGRHRADSAPYARPCARSLLLLRRASRGSLLRRPCAAGWDRRDSGDPRRQPRAVSRLAAPRREPRAETSASGAWPDRRPAASADRCSI